jgi:hypothetical protein
VDTSDVGSAAVLIVILGEPTYPLGMRRVLRSVSAQDTPTPRLGGEWYVLEGRKRGWIVQGLYWSLGRHPRCLCRATRSA